MRLSRWFVPAAVAATVAGGVAVSSAAAGSAPDVPRRTAAEVLAAAATSDVQALSGTVSTRTDLGLPALPGGMGGGPGGGAEGGPDGGDGGSAADPQAVLMRLLTGETTLRVWLDGPQRQRVQLLDPFAEVAFVHDGRDVWTFDTGSNRGTHVVLPAEADLRAAAERAKEAHGGALPPSGAPTAATPQQLAEQLIALADPTTELALGEPATVAGRAAYRLVMTPRTSETLVARAVLAVDAENGMPLRVQVFARGHAEPVIDSGFDDVDFARPAAERFDFTPPAGAEVETVTVPVPDGAHGAADTDGSKDGTKDGTGRAADGAERPDVRVTGSGWASVVEVAPGADTDLAQLRTLLADPMVQQLTTAVDGGRAVSTRLFSALLTDDGRLLVGAVPVETLVAAAR